MSRRDQIRMNDEEIRTFLEEQRILQVATIDHDGWPHLVAMWYVLINDDHATVQQTGEAIWERYTGPLNDNTRQMVTAQAAKRVVIFVKPVEVVSWDHRKLGGRY